jgi:ABC-type transporter Mla maintaining outer membrane lipid asymmetry permease subunit MlaE
MTKNELRKTILGSFVAAVFTGVFYSGVWALYDYSNNELLSFKDYVINYIYVPLFAFIVNFLMFRSMLLKKKKEQSK